MSLRSRFSAYQLYLTNSLGQGLLANMVFATTGLWAVSEVGLNPLQLILIGTALELSIFIFEVPTGVVADAYSRRASIIIGVLLTGVSYIVWGAWPLFATILLAQLMWGLGYTFTSGATEAWITDELGDADTTALFLRASQFNQVGAVLGLGAGVGLGVLDLQLPILLGGALMVVLGLFLAATMPEHGFRPAPRGERASWRRLGGTFMDGLQVVRGSRALTLILVIGLFFGASSEAFDRLWEAQFIRHLGVPEVAGITAVVWLGGIRLVGMVLGLLTAGAARRRLKGASSATIARALLLIDSALLLMMAGFALAGGFVVGAACYLTGGQLRRVHTPLYWSWLNRGLPSSTRATVLSMGGQADALGQVGGGPLLGLLAARASIPAAIFTTSLLLLPALAIYAHLTRRPQPAPTAAVEG